MWQYYDALLQAREEMHRDMKGEPQEQKKDAWKVKSPAQLKSVKSMQRPIGPSGKFRYYPHRSQEQMVSVLSV